MPTLLHPKPMRDLKMKTPSNKKRDCMLNPDQETLTSRLKLINLFAPMIIAMNCIGILLCIYVLFSVGSTINQRSGRDLLQQTREDFNDFTILDRATRSSMIEVREIETNLEIELSNKGVMTMANTIAITEHNAQLFLRLLKVNVYNLTGLIPGTASWYELYAPIIDAAIERSRLRQSQLLEITQYYELAA